MGRRAASGVAFAAFAVLAGLVACSSSVPTIKSGQACSDLATEKCAESSNCAPLEIATRYTDTKACLAREIALCTSALAAESSGDSGTLIEACAQTYPTWMCPDYVAGSTPQGCWPQLGGVANGRACAFSEQCQSAYCAVSPTAVCGACADEPVAGDKCTALLTCGVHGLVCANGVCTHQATQGEPCDDATPCVAGESCVSGAATTAGIVSKGICQPAGAEAGAPCDATSTTLPDCSREAGFSCSAGQCAPIALVTAGGACGTPGTACAASGSCISGVCVAPAADGAACNVAVGPGCAYPARCVLEGVTMSGTCTFPAANVCGPD